MLKAKVKNTNLDGISKESFCWRWKNTNLDGISKESFCWKLKWTKIQIWMGFLMGVFVESESEKNTNLDGILKWCFCWKWNNTKTQLAKQIQIQIWMGFRVFVESERKDVKVILWDESESEIKSKQSKAGYYRLQLIEPVQNLWEWSKPIEIR